MLDSPARFATASQGRFRSARGFSESSPGTTYEPSRSRPLRTASAGALRITVFLPVLESARNSSPRSRSTCSHLRCRISRSRQPVNSSSRIAAAVKGPILVKRFLALGRCLAFGFRSSTSQGTTRKSSSHAGRHLRMACASKRGRRAFVDSGKYRVETAQAAKACRERNLGHGQVGIVDQALGALNPCRLGDLGGRGADMLLEQAQQVSRANAEPLGKRFDARLVERTFVDETHRPLNGGERAFPGGREGRRLGPAAQARSIPCGLGRSGG